MASAAAAAATSITVDSITDFGNTFDRNGLITASTPAAGGAMTINGALAASGVATLTSDRKILIYSSGNDSGVTFAVVGTNSLGTAVTENITGPNVGTVYSTYTYKKVTSVTIGGAGTGSIEVGQVGDPIGIELDAGTVQWTNIGAAVSTTTLTLITGMTSAASVDNHIYTYTSETPRVIEIPEARLHRANDYETPLRIVGRHEYMALPNKSSSGPPNLIYYDKQLNNGVFYTWPVCDDVQEYIKMSARLPVQNLDSLTNDFEVGAEWFEAIAWNLAMRLRPKYGKSVDPLFNVQAQMYLEEAKDSDSENTTVQIQIGTR